MSRISVTARRGRIALATFALAAAPTLGVVLPHTSASAEAEAAASGFQGKVTSSHGLSQRNAPSTHVGKSGASLKRGTVISISCQLNGTSVEGNSRWYKIKGKDRWVSARYVKNIGKAPYACTAGDWDFTVYVSPGTNIRQGPTTKDRKIGTLTKGTEVGTRWITRRGEAIGGVTDWIAVETTSGNRGWINKGNLKLNN